MQTKQISFLLRLDESEDSRSIITPLLARCDQTKPYFVVFETGEDGENPHFHLTGYLKPGKSLQSLRTFVNRSGIKGQDAYSLKLGIEEKIDSHYTYLCKGDSVEAQPEIIHCHPDFTDTIIAERHETYWEVNAELPKKRRKTKTTNAADAISRICFDTMSHNGGRKLLEDEIIDISVEWVHKNRKTLNDFYLRSLINHVAYTVNRLEDETGDPWDSNRMTQLRNKLKYQTF